MQGPKMPPLDREDQVAIVKKWLSTKSEAIQRLAVNFPPTIRATLDGQPLFFMDYHDNRAPNPPGIIFHEG